ncbi:MAG: class I SAM-dependent methyltransferase [Sandaracinus sp.]
MSTTPAEPATDFAQVKSGQREAWGMGDYAVIGTTLQLVGETLCEAADLRAGARVLDVGAGNGNASLAAARRWCEVTSSDYVPPLLQAGRRRADAEGLSLQFVVADAEQLPFEDASFDYVLSTFGVMFAPNQPLAAAELLRVCRAGGRVALASWTPDGFVGELLRVVGRYAPPRPSVPSPALWGTRGRIDELFPSASVVSSEVRTFTFRYVSARHFVDVFRTFYGPIHRVYASVSRELEPALTTDLLELLARHDRGRGESLVVPSTYLEVVLEKR